MSASNPSRRVALAGLVVIAAWTVVVVIEMLTQSPWTHDDRFGQVSFIIDDALAGAVPVLGIVWLSGRAKGFLRP